jgi:hypothetical protein
VNLVVAMARMALVLDRGRHATDEPGNEGKLWTIQISNLDVEALQVCMRELLALRAIARSMGLGRGGESVAP